MRELRIGDCVVWDEQVYRLASVRPYVNRFGVQTEIRDWQSSCPDCGKVFSVTLWRGVVPGAKKVNRRCEECRPHAKRKPVTAMGRHKRAVYLARVKGVRSGARA